MHNRWVAALSGCATPPVEPGAMQAVQCVADELRATGRIYDVQFSRGFRHAYTTTKPGYGFNDLAGGHHVRWIELAYGAAGKAHGYDRTASHPNDPAQDVAESWLARCKVEGVLFFTD